MTKDSFKIDFSQLKRMFQKGKEEHDEQKSQEQGTEKKESFTIDRETLIKNLQRALPVVLLLIALFLAYHPRIQPASLPIAERWAADAVNGYFRDQIRQQVDAQYPNLPEQRKSSLVEEEFSKFILNNPEQYRQQVQATTEQFRAQFQDETGQTYLLAIDPYYYYRLTRNLLDHGHVGDTLGNNEPFDTYTLAPIGEGARPHFHNYVEMVLYKIWQVFDRDVGLMTPVFYVSAIIATLCVIPLFFIVRRFAGDFAAFFAVVFLGVNTNFLSRTVAGFSDTDAYAVLFPLLILWIFLEAQAAKQTKWKWILTVLAGFLTGLFSYVWGGWWYIFVVIVAGTLIALVYTQLVQHPASLQELLKNMKEDTLLLGAYFVTVGISVTFFTKWSIFLEAFTAPLSMFYTFKEAAKASLWPNVYTTVAELNEVSLGSIVSSLGGKVMVVLTFLGFVLFLAQGVKTKGWFVGGSLVWYAALVYFQPGNAVVFSALLLIPLGIGVILSIIQKEKTSIGPIFIATLWAAAMIYASTQGVRFIMLIVPAFAIGLGLFIGFCLQEFATWAEKNLHTNKMIVVICLIIGFSLFLINPVKAAYQVAYSEVPSFNDAWNKAMQAIQQNTQPNAIITSWWDFGHWFKAMADRPVTFDGGNQNNPRAHWVGSLLMNADERVSLGILRMLDCGAKKVPLPNTGYEIVTPQEMLAAELSKESSAPIVGSVDMLYSIFGKNREEAKAILTSHVPEEVAEEVLQYTHCAPPTLPEAIVITSEDMVSKAGVWSHFGGWNFRRARIWRDVRKMKEQEALHFIQELGYGEAEARELYQQVRALKTEQEGNAWISPWPGYAGVYACSTVENSTSIQCTMNMGGKAIPVSVNLETLEADIQANEGIFHPNSVTLVVGEELREQVYEENVVGVSIGLIEQNGGYAAVSSNPQLATSLFSKLFYFQGAGTKHFTLINRERDASGLDILTWKVDWGGYLQEIGET